MSEYLTSILLSPSIISVDIDCIAMDGTPTLYISLIIARSGLNICLPKLILTSSLYFTLKIKDNVIATICPETVAIAAPAMPSLGAPKSPKINIGSKIIFIIAPTP